MVAFVQRDQLTGLQIAAVLALVLVSRRPSCSLSDWWVPWWLDMVARLLGRRHHPVHAHRRRGSRRCRLVGPDVQSSPSTPPRTASGSARSPPRPPPGCWSWPRSAGHLDALGMHLVITALGLMAGAMLHTQSRALAAERSALAVEHDRATMAERNRIAREIHDLVAHSLSVTMLHITGARRLLADSAGSEGDDVDEAIEALRDAERVGRQAMNDIRQTVSELATEGDPNRALPSADDLPGARRVRSRRRAASRATPSDGDIVAALRPRPASASTGSSRSRWPTSPSTRRDPPRTSAWRWPATRSASPSAAPAHARTVGRRRRNRASPA